MTDTFKADFGIGDEPRAQRLTISQEDPRCGFFPDMTDDQYFADPIEEGSLSNSDMTPLLEETPLEFAYNNPRINPDAPPRKVSAAMGLGDIVHQLALGKGKGFAIGDFKDWKTKAAQEFKAEAEAAGKTPIKRTDFESAEIIADVVIDQIEAALDGADYQTEVAIIWKEPTPWGEIYMRGKLDVWCPERLMILDPKITAQLNNDDYPRQMANMGWQRQAAVYTRGVEQLIPEAESRVKFGNIMVKPTEPFVSRVIWADKGWKRLELHEARRAMEIFARCMQSGQWPGYPEEGETARIPYWYEKQLLAAELGEDDAA